MKSKIFTLLFATLLIAFSAKAQERRTAPPEFENHQTVTQAKYPSKSTVIFEDDFETDKGWTLEAPFEIGVATNEPDEAHSGAKILGGPLNIDYTKDQADAYATSPTWYDIKRGCI